MKESREEAIARLAKSASELEARTANARSAEISAHAVTSQAYKIIAELLGGVIVGIAVGFALSLWMARRTANRLMAQAKAAGIQAEAIPFEEAGEED